MFNKNADSKKKIHTTYTSEKILIFYNKNIDIL